MYCNTALLRTVKTVIESHSNQMLDCYSDVIKQLVEKDADAFLHNKALEDPIMLIIDKTNYSYLKILLEALMKKDVYILFYYYISYVKSRLELVEEKYNDLMQHYKLQYSNEVYNLNSIISLLTDFKFCFNEKLKKLLCKTHDNYDNFHSKEALCQTEVVVECIKEVK